MTSASATASAAAPRVQATRVLLFAGSSRQGSFNTRLTALAAQAVRDQGGVTTELDLLTLQLPIYEARIEAAGMPDGALALRDLLAGHEALIVVSPEYNGFPTPLLINAMDWASRPAATNGRPSGLAAMAGKPVAVMSASPGALGGVRSLGHTRQFLHNTLGLLVLPEQLALGQAGQAFDAQGQLVDDKHQQGLQRVVRAVLRMGAALHGR